MVTVNSGMKEVTMGNKEILSAMQLSNFLYRYCYYSMNDEIMAGNSLDMAIDGPSQDIKIQAENLKLMLQAE